MEKKFEKIDESILKQIQDNQTKASEISFEVGQLHFRLREIQKELRNVQSAITAKENDFDGLNLEISKILADLNEKYPNGELDLKEGGVFY